MGFWVKRLNEADKGRWLISFLQWFATLAILFKVYDFERWLVLGTIILVIGTWMVGWVFVKSGLWDAYNRQVNIGIKEWFTKKD